ncbi:MAG TPA: glycosyl hydrolase [Tepidisphaeraceae bacterium]|jgi:hypothetical protein
MTLSTQPFLRLQGGRSGAIPDDFRSTETIFALAKLEAGGGKLRVGRNARVRRAIDYVLWADGDSDVEIPDGMWVEEGSEHQTAVRVMDRTKLRARKLRVAQRPGVSYGGKLDAVRLHGLWHEIDNTDLVVDDVDGKPWQGDRGRWHVGPRGDGQPGSDYTEYVGLTNCMIPDGLWYNAGLPDRNYKILVRGGRMALQYCPFPGRVPPVMTFLGTELLTPPPTPTTPDSYYTFNDQRFGAWPPEVNQPMRYHLCTDSRDVKLLEVELAASGAEGLVLWIGYWRAGKGGNGALDALPVVQLCKRLKVACVFRLVPSTGYKPTAAESASAAQDVIDTLAPHMPDGDKIVIVGNEPTGTEYGPELILDKAGKVQKDKHGNKLAKQWTPDDFFDHVFAPIATAFRAAGWKIVLTPVSIKADGTNVDGSQILGYENWLRRFFRRGAADLCDYLSIHPYQLTAAGHLKYLDALIRIAAEFGVELPIFITEWCLGAFGALPPNFEAEMRKLPPELGKRNVVALAYFIDREHAQSKWRAYLFKADGSPTEHLALFVELRGRGGNVPSSKPPKPSPAAMTVAGGVKVEGGKHRTFQASGVPAGTATLPYAIAGKTRSAKGVAYVGTAANGWTPLGLDTRVDGEWAVPMDVVAIALDTQGVELARFSGRLRLNGR